MSSSISRASSYANCITLATSRAIIAILIVSSSSSSSSAVAPASSAAGFNFNQSSTGISIKNCYNTQTQPTISSFVSSCTQRRQIIKIMGDNSSDEDAEFANFDLEAAILAASPQKKCTLTGTKSPSTSTVLSNLRRQTPAKRREFASSTSISPKENNMGSTSDVGRSGNDGISTSTSSSSSSCCRINDIYPLTLVSWNIAELEPSYSAPGGRRYNQIRREMETPRMIRDICLLRESSSSSTNPPPPPPDIIALQECPHPSFGQYEFGPYGYISAGTRASHCGYVDLLVRKELISSSSSSAAITTMTTSGACSDDGYSTPPTTTKRSREAEEQQSPQQPPLRMKTIPTPHLPSVAATITLPDSTRIAISSSHLMWSKEGAAERKNQYTSLMRQMLQHATNCILLGDFNMRTAEDVHAENALQDDGGGRKWIDAWKASPPGPIKYASKFTWDSFINKYHEDGFQYRARYDRCYYRGEDIVGVEKFDLIGNRPVEDRPGEYLSDHFGMVVVLGVRLREITVKEDEEDDEDDQVEIVGVIKGGILSK